MQKLCSELTEAGREVKAEQYLFLFLKFIFFNGWMGVALVVEDPWEGIDKENFKVVKKVVFSKICWLQNLHYLVDYAQTLVPPVLNIFSCVSSSMNENFTDGLRDSRTDSHLAQIFSPCLPLPPYASRCLSLPPYGSQWLPMAPYGSL